MSELNISNMLKSFGYYRWIIIVLFLAFLGFLIFIFSNIFFLSNRPVVLTPVSTLKPIKVSSKVNSGNPSGRIGSFGDAFSGWSYIDKNRTNMFLDYDVTAFTFPPLYDLKPEPKLTQLISPTPDLCLGQGAGKRCVKVRHNNLYVNDIKVTWPPDLSAKNILSVNVFILRGATEARWIVGVVTGKKYDEQGWVYFFNSRDFTPLITATTKNKIKLRFKRSGGKIYFGGKLSDFLILYSGYNGQAFYNHKGTLTNVSKFFGLRVTRGGFPAEILRTTNSRGTVFYVCSQNSAKLILIKLWSHQPGKLSGALSFSNLLYNKSKKETGCNLVRDHQKPKVLLGFKQAGNINNWSFTDKGFDNSRARQVTSNNLWFKRKPNILAAEIKQLSVESDSPYFVSSSSSAPMVKLFLSNRPDNWQAVSPHNWYKFNNPTNAFYWRAVFQPEHKDQNYSPWFYNVNELLYKIEQ